VVSFAYCIAPTASAHCSAVAKSTASSIAASPWPSAPSSASARTCTPSSLTSAARWLSMLRYGVVDTPFAFAATMNSEMPCASPGEPEVRAETTSRSASGAPTTTRLSPFSTQPSPAFFAVADTWASR